MTITRSKSVSRSGFVQQRHVDDGERIVADQLERAQARGDGAIDRRVHDRFEVAARRRIGEDDRPELRRDRRRRPASRIPAPKRAAIAAVASVPAAVTPCASSSASRHGTPRRRNWSSTWLLPVAMPPVSATFEHRRCSAGEQGARGSRRQVAYMSAPRYDATYRPHYPTHDYPTHARPASHLPALLRS